VIHVHVRLFASLRELAGRREQSLDLADGATVADVWPALRLGDAPAGLAHAVNRGYVDASAPLRDGDEVALIPPVSGGAEEVRPHVEVTAEPIDLATVAARVAHPGAGAVVTFSGVVRDSSRDRAVEHLDYEVFEEMALEELRRIARHVATRHSLLGIAVVHRSGRCEIGETTVVIACAAAHRAEALAACGETIDTLKAHVPIWKKEHYVDGAAWIGQGS
jgi:molybdopterin synthase catalytic subunit